MTTQSTERAALRELAGAWGVQRVHVGNDGSRRTPSDDALVAVLNALGADLSGPADAPARLADRRAALAARPIEPVLLAWNGRLPAFDVALPRGARARRRVRCHVALEDGAPLAFDAVTAARRTARLTYGGRLPLGVHQLVVEGAAPGTAATILSAPRMDARRRPGRVGSLHAAARASFQPKPRDRRLR